MSDSLEITLLKRLDQVSDQVSKVAVQVGKLDGVSNLLEDHNKRIQRLETWQARLIGGYAAGALLFGVLFQVFLRQL